MGGLGSPSGLSGDMKSEKTWRSGELKEVQLLIRDPTEEFCQDTEGYLDSLACSDFGMRR